MPPKVQGYPECKVIILAPLNTLTADSPAKAFERQLVRRCGGTRRPNEPPRVDPGAGWIGGEPVDQRDPFGRRSVRSQFGDGRLVVVPPP